MSAPGKLPVADELEDDFPSPEHVAARFAADRKGPLPPWLTPDALAAARELAVRGVPEINGPVDGTIPEDD